MKKIVALVLALALAFACAPTVLAAGGGCTWDSGVLTITSRDGFDNWQTTVEGAGDQITDVREIVIQDQVAGQIPVYAFSDIANRLELTGLERVKIGSGITSIGHGGFSFSSLETVEGGQNVETLGDAAFQNCLLPSDQVNRILRDWKLTEVPSAAFVNGSTYTDVTVPGNIRKIGQEALAGGWTQAAGFLGRLESLTVEQGVEEIGPRAFFRNHNLAAVTLPDSLTKIGDQAFEDTPFSSAELTVAGETSLLSDDAFHNGAANVDVRMPDGKTFHIALVQDGGALTLPAGSTYTGQVDVREGGVLTLPAGSAYAGKIVLHEGGSVVNHSGRTISVYAPGADFPTQLPSTGSGGSSGGSNPNRTYDYPGPITVVDEEAPVEVPETGAPSGGSLLLLAALTGGALLVTRGRRN